MFEHTVFQGQEYRGLLVYVFWVILAHFMCTSQGWLFISELLWLIWWLRSQEVHKHSIRGPLGLVHLLFEELMIKTHMQGEKKNTYGINNSIEITCVQDNNEIKGRANEEFCWSFMLRFVCISQLEVQRRSIKKHRSQYALTCILTFRIIRNHSQIGIFVLFSHQNIKKKKEKNNWDPLWMKELPGVCELMKS